MLWKFSCVNGLVTGACGFIPTVTEAKCVLLLGFFLGTWEIGFCGLVGGATADLDEARFPNGRKIFRNMVTKVSDLSLRLRPCVNVFDINYNNSNNHTRVYYRLALREGRKCKCLLTKAGGGQSEVRANVVALILTIKKIKLIF